MALITFLSDFGTSDHYVAAVKAAIMSVNPGLQIVDITHEVASCNLAEASYLLESVFRDFPKGTVHMVAVNSTGKREDKPVAVKLEDHFFVGPDNGIFSLISTQKPTAIVTLDLINKKKTTFPARNMYAQAASYLASGKSIHDLGQMVPELNTLIKKKGKTTKKQITGHVIHIDHYGNLITNISKEDFDTIMELNQQKGFEISFGRERSTEIHESYFSVEGGECFFIFNQSGLLEIGINNGHGSDLLGLHYDSPVFINFVTE
jgi:S-adenosyl-L-methionine hydrolase (adenosine-forming)